jgi:hypothetical protein
MDIHDLIDMTTTNVGKRVEVTLLEPAELSPGAVPGLALIVSELVGHVGVADAGRMAASWDGDDYLITITWREPDMAVGVLDRLLQDPEMPLAMASVARVARGHGIVVRFVPGPDALTAQITIPASLATKSQPSEVLKMADQEDVPFVAHELERRVPVAVGSWVDESEAFLEKVFAPLRLSRSTPVETSDGMALQVRVPGERFTDVDDSPSTVAAEAAVEIRSALSTYDRGRRSAELAG